MVAGLAEKAFHDAFAALKSGGVLGVVQARAEYRRPAGPSGQPTATCRKPFVKQLATETGFTFDKASEINANPKDRKDAKKPLPCSLRPVEPDRMTLAVHQAAINDFRSSPFACDAAWRRSIRRPDSPTPTIIDHPCQAGSGACRDRRLQAYRSRRRSPADFELAWNMEVTSVVLFEVVVPAEGVISSR